MGDDRREVTQLRQKLAAATDAGTRARLLNELADKLYYSSPSEAEVCMRQAVESARSAGDPDALGTALCTLAFRLFEAGRFDEGLLQAEEALALGRRSGERKVEAKAHNALGCVYNCRGETQKSIEHYQQCLKISREIGYEGGVSTATANLAAHCVPLGKYEEAIGYIREALLMEQKREDWPAIAISYENLGRCYEETGDWDRALECYYRELAIAEQRQIRTQIACGLSSVGFLYRKRGKLDRALDLLSRSVQLAEELGFVVQLVTGLAKLADTYLARGDILAAHGVLDRYRALVGDLGDPMERLKVRETSAEVALASGDAQSARNEISLAVKEADEAGAPIELGCSLRILGEVLAALGESGPAIAAFQRSTAVLSGTEFEGTDFGVSYLLARTHSSFGRFLASEKNVEQAADELTRAAGLFRRLGILQYAEEANRRISELRGPPAKPEDWDFGLLRSLSGLLTWQAPASEVAQAFLSLLAEGLQYSGGALFLYARPPYIYGDMPMGRVLSMPRCKDVTVSSQAIQVPVRLKTRDVGMLCLAGPKPGAQPPGRGFWDVVADLLALGVDRIQARVRSGALPSDGSAPRVTVKELDVESSTLRYGRIVSGGKAMNDVLEVIERVAPTRASVLVRGESGTGKELVARSIHDLSPRRDRPLVIINCAALPETLLEAELFGIEKGVATGVGARIGKLEQASGGTVFLDEVGDMSLTIQAKLLRVIQEREFERLGSQKTIAADVRFIAATNRDLEAAAKDGQFREDLFHRLNVISVRMPTLSERHEEIPLLVEHFIRKYSEEFLRPVQAMSGAAVDALLAYAWPGNIRELENVIERAVILAREGVITHEDLPAALQRTGGPQSTPQENGLKARKRAARQEVRESLERDVVLRAFEQHEWRIPDVQKELGISRSHLYRMLRKYNLRRPGKT